MTGGGAGSSRQPCGSPGGPARSLGTVSRSDRISPPLRSSPRPAPRLRHRSGRRRTARWPALRASVRKTNRARDTDLSGEPVSWVAQDEYRPTLIYGEARARRHGPPLRPRHGERAAARSANTDRPPTCRLGSAPPASATPVAAKADHATDRAGQRSSATGNAGTGTDSTVELLTAVRM